MKAHAVVFEDVRRVSFREIVVPDPGPNDVLLRTRFSLISNGTEGSFLRGERVEGDVPARPGDPLPFPQVTGYQKVGIVERAPAGSGLEAGQWAHCTVSKVGLPDRPFGGHVSISVADVSQVYGLPKGLDPVEAAGLVLTQVGYNCGMRPVLKPGEPAVVLGDGMVGLWAAATLQHRGAAVTLVGKHAYRHRRFQPGRQDHVIDLGTHVDLETAVREACPSGIAALVDTVGCNDAIATLFEQFRRDSHVVSAGFLGTRGAIDIQMLRNRETTLHCPSGWTRERMERTLELLAAGVLRLTPLITHRLPAGQAAEAFRMILDKQDGVLGILLEWN
jgi:2-desacetyl-2-hydroxyethyl bacteriochlorophyllide A dehydrogenase